MLKHLQEMEKLQVPDTSVDDQRSYSAVQLSWRQLNLAQQDKECYARPCAVGIGGTTVKQIDNRN